MKINEVVLNNKTYSFYSWITNEDADWDNGRKRFLDDNTTVNEIRETESGYNTKVTFNDGFVKWVYLTEDCYGEAIINGVSHRYKLVER